MNIIQRFKRYIEKLLCPISEEARKEIYIKESRLWRKHCNKIKKLSESIDLDR